MKERFFTMFFKKVTFLMFLACFASVTGNALAGACYDSVAGVYCMTYERYTCPKGCYCTAASSPNGALDKKGNGRKNIYKDQVINWCSSRDKSKCSWSDGGNQCGTSNNAGIFLCSADYPNSGEGAKKASDCYWTCGSGTKYAGQTLYDVSYSCSAGKYLPKGSNDCADCPSDGKSICPGVSSYHKKCAGSSSDQGLKACDAGMEPNSNKTSCVKASAPKYKCIAGEYLPANSEACEACPEGKLCLGGTWEKRAVSQGDDDECEDDTQIINSKGSACIPCPKGKKANETYTECVEGDPIKVNPGEYLPANSITPKKCNNARRFCPGGSFRMLSIDQGQYECPNGGTVSADKKSCILTLDKKQMRCGPNGVKANSEQCVSETPCWIKTDPEDFINCIYGVRFDVPSAETTNAETTE